MYLVIVEGTDNIGKDTLINELVKLFDTVTLIHCSSPKGRCFRRYEQDNTFMTYATNIVNKAYDNTDCIIMNRSHIGEYVYGQIYRNRDPYETAKMVEHIDQLLLSRNDLTIKYVQLLSSSIELRLKYDDNNSLSIDKDKMSKETRLFKEIFRDSVLDKKLIYVNNNNEFRPKEDIFNEVVDFLNK